MQDTIYGLIILGMCSGVIPAVLAVIIFQILKGAFRAMGRSVRALKEKKPPEPVKRNVREELWDETEANAMEQFMKEVAERRRG